MAALLAGDEISASGGVALRRAAAPTDPNRREAREGAPVGPAAAVRGEGALMRDKYSNANM